MKLIIAISMLLGLSAAHAEDGVTNTEIVIGSTAAKSGPEGVYGTQMALGAQAYYDRINAAGGVNGRKIRFIATDDMYEPEKAAANVKKLVEEDKVFAIVGGNGTAGTKAFFPYVIARGVPLLFRYTGGDILYDQPPQKYVFQTRISYAAEAENLITFAVKKLGIKDFAVFYQDDGFGTAGRAGVAKALSNHGLKIAVDGKHARNTVEMDKALEDILKVKPGAVYMQTNARPAVAFIKAAAAKGYKPVYLAASPMNSVNTAEALGTDADNFYVSEVVPNPLDPSLAITKQYQKDMKAIGQERFEPISFESYIGAVVFVEALKKMGKEVTRENLKKALEGMHDYDIGGVKVDFSAKKHHGFNSGFINLIKQGKLQAVKF